MIELIEQLAAAEKSCHEAIAKCSALQAELSGARSEEARLMTLRRDLYRQLQNELCAKAGVPGLDD